MVYKKIFWGDLEAKTYAQNSGIIFTFRIQKNFFEIPIGKKNSKNCLHFITFVYHKGGILYHICGIVCYTCGILYHICGIQKIKIRLFKDLFWDEGISLNNLILIFVYYIFCIPQMWYSIPHV